MDGLKISFQNHTYHCVSYTAHQDYCPDTGWINWGMKISFIACNTFLSESQHLFPSLPLPLFPALPTSPPNIANPGNRIDKENLESAVQGHIGLLKPNKEQSFMQKKTGLP